MEFNLSNIPDSSEMFARFASETWSLTLLILVMVLTVFTLCLYVEVVLIIHRRLEFGSRRGYVIFMTGLFVAHSITSLLGLCIPAASFACNFLADIYMAVALYVIILFITELFGGLDSTVRALSMVDVPLRQPPLCCLCFCLPRITVNRKVFHLIRAGVMQYIITLLVFVLMPALLWMDQLLKPNQSSNVYESIDPVATLISILSTILAIYSVLLLFRAARIPLRGFHLPGHFISVQLALILVNFQRVLFWALIRFGAIGCIRPLTCAPDLVMKIITNFLILIEMPFLAILSRVVIAMWLRSSTYTKQFEADTSAVVEGDKSLDKHNDGSFENKTTMEMTQDERDVAASV